MNSRTVKCLGKKGPCASGHVELFQGSDPPLGASSPGPGSGAKRRSILLVVEIRQSHRPRSIRAAASLTRVHIGRLACLHLDWQRSIVATQAFNCSLRRGTRLLTSCCEEGAWRTGGPLLLCFGGIPGKLGQHRLCFGLGLALGHALRKDKVASGRGCRVSWGQLLNRARLVGPSRSPDPSLQAYPGAERHSPPAC